MNNEQRPDERSNGRLRVAYVVHTFDMGGLERCVARLASHLDPSRFEPSVVCLNRNGDAAQWLERDGIPIVEIHKRAGNDPKAIWRLARAFREAGTDIVHSHNWGTLIETAVARRAAGVSRHVHAERGMELEALHIGAFRGALRNRASAWAMRTADAVVAVSSSIRDRLATCGIMPNQRVRVIPNAIAAVPGCRAEERSRIRKELGIGESGLLIGSVGRLARVKDFGNAIDAVAGLVRDGRDVYLALVGDGPEREPLAQRLHATGLAKRCHLVGWQLDVWSWLAAMDIYINSSLSEGMSQSILEAMAAGLPSVVTDVGDSAVLVRGDRPCGLVAQPGDAEALKNQLGELSASSALRREFGENASWRISTQYNLPRMLQSYQDLYCELSHRCCEPVACS